MLDADYSQVYTYHAYTHTGVKNYLFTFLLGSLRVATSVVGWKEGVDGRVGWMERRKEEGGWVREIDGIRKEGGRRVGERDRGNWEERREKDG